MGTSLQRRMDAKLGTAIGPQLHQAGYELWRVGTQYAVIRRKLKITNAQWKWLLEKGNDQMPPYQDMLVDEVTAIRSAASQAAVALATDGVAVLRKRVGNAEVANDLIQGILRQVAQAVLVNELAADPHTKVIARFTPKPMLDALKVLIKVADLGPAANAFRTIYGDVAAQRALYPLADAPKRDEGRPLHLVQGDDADRDSFLSPDAAQEVLDDMRAMSPEELQAFADGGDEPPPQ